jgi:serine protease AprX
MLEMKAPDAAGCPKLKETGSMNMRIRTVLAIGTAALAGVVAPLGHADPGSRPVAPAGLLAAASAGPSRSFPIIVTTAPGSPVTTAGSNLHDVSGRTYGRLTRSFTVVHGGAATVSGKELLQLVGQPGVLSVTPDAPVAQDAFAPVPPQDWRAATGLESLPPTENAPAIAVVDSGVSETLAQNVVESVNLASDGAQTTTDLNGHGTLVAGIAAGASSDYPGAAPNAPIVSLRVIGADGSARTSDVIAAADWIYRNRDAYDIRVANFSLHSSAPASAVEDPLDLAVRRLWLSGTVVVAAAGNDGAQRMLYAPGSDPFVITVGAVGTNGTPATADDTAAPWSSYGYTADGFAKPEIAAPGRMLVGPTPMGSSIAQTFSDRIVAPGWIWMSGTSLAAPVVSGIAARLLALHPLWTPDQVKGALLASATPLAGDPAVGAGEANAAAAAALAAPPNPNEALDAFVTTLPTGEQTFDGSAWRDAVASASWASASWASASWASASWASTAWSATAFADASWASASWASASWASASWASASWASASWASASWASASWASASWASASWASASWASAFAGR